MFNEWMKIYDSCPLDDCDEKDFENVSPEDNCLFEISERLMKKFGYGVGYL